MENCIFCKIAQGEVPVDFIYENDNFVSFADANPLVSGHSLVVPKKHFETILDLPNTLWSELSDCIKNTALKVLDKWQAEGFNVVQNNKKVAGQEVGHLHFHIIPRKKGDEVRGFSK